MFPSGLISQSENYSRTFNKLDGLCPQSLLSLQALNLAKEAVAACQGDEQEGRGLLWQSRTTNSILAAIGSCSVDQSGSLFLEAKGSIDQYWLLLPKRAGEFHILTEFVAAPP